MTQSLREQLIGAWTLVSYEERPVDGSPRRQSPLAFVVNRSPLIPVLFNLYHFILGETHGSRSDWPPPPAAHA